jgi:hypothetical protein
VFQADKDKHSAQISHRLSPRVGDGGLPASGENPANDGNWMKNCCCGATRNKSLNGHFLPARIFRLGPPGRHVMNKASRIQSAAVGKLISHLSSNHRNSSRRPLNGRPTGIHHRKEDQKITKMSFSILNLNKPTRPGMERAPTSTNLTRPLPIHRLEGKVAFITGGGGKVGVETAGRLLIEGANVALIDINQPALEAAVPCLKAAIPTGVPLESRLLTIAADMTVEADVEACVKKTVQRFGRLDCALLNAGEREESKSLFDTTEEDYDKIMNTNAKSGMPPIQPITHESMLTTPQLFLHSNTSQRFSETKATAALSFCAPASPVFAAFPALFPTHPANSPSVASH